MSDTGKKNDQLQLAGRTTSVVADGTRLQEEITRLQSELHITTTKLDSETQRADTAESMKDRFLANINHEIRTPMNGILGMTELLLDTKLTDQQLNFTNSIARSTESLLFVVNDMLDFSGLHHGKLDLEENVFFFSKVLRDVCDQYAEKATAKNITLVCNTQSQLQAPVIGDEFRIKQILSNLIDNAIKFTEQGEIKVVEESCSGSGIFKVSIEDTGSGIATDVQSDIFKSFEQADNSSTRKYGGTGLGLAIANRLAHLMGGEIAMQSELGHGSKFTFSCKLSEGNDEAINKIGKNLLSGTRVLVVDDTETNLEILSLQLQQWDLDVQTASSGQEALELLDTAAKNDTPIQLAILDLNMPNMDGLELARHIQTQDYADQLRVMMLTSSVINLNEQGLKEHGIVRSMMKPARQALLYDALNRIFQEEKTQDPIPAPARNTRILLTEDDPINQEVATTMLESMGYEVMIANNGADAVDAILQDNDIDLILMDCQMPVMDGFNATRAIREKKVKTPIIALTANAMQGDRDMCLDAGMDDYLTKPIFQTDLARVVQQWVSRIASDKDHQHSSHEENNSSIAEDSMNIEIDETALDAIRSLQRPGKPDILARIVNMYIEKSPELITSIQEGVAANDCDKVKMAAHTLKSSSAYVGASSLAEVCNRVEARAAKDELGEAADDIHNLSTGFTSVVDQIKKYA